MRMMTRFFWCVVLSLPLLACEQVQLRPKTNPSEKTTGFPQTETGDLFLRDAPGGLFKNLKWYFYEPSTHLIWPLYDIYAIRTGEQIFLLQIQAYYDGNVETAGHFQVGLRGQQGAPLELRFDASACGNPFTNPDFENCQRDPNRNVFLYLNLSQQRFWKMPESEALHRRDWDLAFRGTEIRLNSGVAGPGDVQGALARRFAFFFDSAGQPNLAAVQNRNLQEEARQTFFREPFHTDYPYALAEGLDRVIHERYWYVETPDGKREAQPERRWRLRSRDEQRQLEFRVVGIDEDAGGETGKTRIHVGTKLAEDTEKETTFDLNANTQLTSICWSFKMDGGLLQVDCQPKDWDLRFMAAHRRKGESLTRDWRFLLGGAGRGPLSGPLK